MLSETRRTGVTCRPEHVASYGCGRTVERPTEGWGAVRIDDSSETVEKRGKAKKPERLRVGTWRRREGGQGALSCRKGQGLRAHLSTTQGHDWKTVERPEPAWDP